VKGKPAMGLLLGLSPKGKSDEEDAMPSAQIAAAKALISAVKSGDAEAVSEALQSHYDSCASGSEPDEDD
jgi:DNA-binding GntR family transcriptional regulator